MPAETINWRPLAEGLPDAETNVMLALERGSSCEGFYDGEEPDGRHVWRDVCAVELRDEKVTHWADMPKGPNAC